MGQAENCVKMSTKFWKFSIKNTDREFIIFIAVTSPGRGGSFCCLYVCIRLANASHNHPKKVNAN